VQVGSESIEWDILLWTSGSVGKARVVGAFMMEMSVCSQFVDQMAGGPTEEDGEQSDVLLRWIRDCL
jgi:hypothetical protein